MKDEYNNSINSKTKSSNVKEEYSNSNVKKDYINEKENKNVNEKNKNLIFGKYNMEMESDCYSILGNQNQIRILKKDILSLKILRKDISKNSNVPHFGGGDDMIIINPIIPKKNNPYLSILEKEIISEKIQLKEESKIGELDEDLVVLDDEYDDKPKTQQINNDTNVSRVNKNNNSRQPTDLNIRQPTDLNIRQPTDLNIRQPTDLNIRQQPSIDYDNINPNPFVSNQNYQNTPLNRPLNKPMLTTKSEPTLLMEQKVYNTSNIQQKEQKPQPPMFIPIYENQPMETVLPFPYVLQPNHQKIYNINFGDKFSNFGGLDRLYEDYLPGGSKKFTATTLYERSNLIHFIKNSIIKQHDGEEMSLTGNSDVLLSYIKILNINSYNKNVNPFKNLAKKFILYTAAYPIKYNETTTKIEIGNPAMGLNVRIYGLTESDYKHEMTNKYTSNVWREIQYYDYIRDNIIKKKISPNFICPILYKIDRNSKINWLELESVKEEHLPNYIIEIIRKNCYKVDDNKDTDTIYNMLKNLHKDNPEIVDYIEHVLEKKTTIMTTITGRKYYIKDNKEINVPVNIEYHIPDDLYMQDKITKNAIILLTEAPTTNFIQWCSITRESFGSVHRMTSSGFHQAKVWKSIIFQLVYIFATLQQACIFMEEITLEDNFYIKDVFVNPNTIGSWIYKICNIEYYVPNYGYILMFDSKFTDPKSKDTKYKILSSTIFPKHNMISILPEDKYIKEKIYDIFMNIIDALSLTHYAKMSNMNIIDQSISDLLSNIKSKGQKNKLNNNINISDILDDGQIFTDFLHNRLGTYLSKIERENIITITRPNIKEGDICIYKDDDFKWALCIKIDKTHAYILKYTIIYKSKKKGFCSAEITSGRLTTYLDKLIPENSGDMRYDSSYIYETYEFDNLINYIKV